MNQLYKTMNITKQAVHQNMQRQKIFESKVTILLAEFEQLRSLHPGCGLEKAYYTLNPDFIGRDNFIELFRQLGYKISLARNFKKTTYAVSSKYKNLIEGLRINKPSLVWQSDITYIEINNRFYYAVFIIDVYTKQMVGFNISDSLRAESNIKALKQALKKFKAPEIHHSDKGSQYIYHEYISLLQKANCKISMSGSAQENAYAERVNRTIKEEFLSKWKINTFEELKKRITQAVSYYNNHRIHLSLDRYTPNEFAKLWYEKKIKKSFFIFTMEKQNSTEGDGGKNIIGNKKTNIFFQSSSS